MEKGEGHQETNPTNDTCKTVQLSTGPQRRKTKRPEEPGEDTIRKMFLEAMKIALSFIMKNHLYAFDHKIKLQLKGRSHRFGTYRGSSSVVYGLMGQAVQDEDG